jgi:hypothetical protein
MPPSLSQDPIDGRITLKTPGILSMAVLVTAAAFLVSCGEKREAERKKYADVQGKVLAAVNGVQITDTDMRVAQGKVAGHGMGASPDAARNVLETLVREELVYQKSLELNLDGAPEYRRKLHEIEAQVKAFQRQEMARRFREYVRGEAGVTDSEAREYFEKNRNRIQSKYHVWQMFYRGEESRMKEDLKDLKSGMPFEKVAARRFPKLPENMKAPWDMGYLRWNQVPLPWKDVVDRLEPGQSSDAIDGGNGRFWVIRLVEKSVDPNVTFDAEKEAIVSLLREQKSEELYKSLLGEMERKSKIIYAK